MARCGCSSDRCACNFVAGDGVTITGVGSPSNPYVVEVAPSSIGGGGGGTGRLSGEIIAYGGPAAPTGWLACDGTAVSRTVYSALFAVMGVAYGAGNGTTTFNLPDLTGRFPMGLSGTRPRGSAGGDDAVTLTQANLPSHSHAIDHDHAQFTTTSGGTHAHEYPKQHSNADGVGDKTYRDGDSNSVTLLPASGAHTHDINVPPYAGNSGSAGGGQPVDVLPPFAAVNYIIKT